MSRRIAIGFREAGRPPLVILERGRAGGSYTVTAHFEHGWLIVRDEYHNQRAWPADIIDNVEVNE